jgi:Effector Associated Constant Component 1
LGLPSERSLGMITVNLEDAGEDDIMRFYRWILEDEEIRRTASIQPGQSSQGLSSAGPMGGEFFDVINLTVTSGFSAASLVLSYATWRDAHGKAGKLVIRNGKKKAIVEGASEADISRVVDLLSDDR